MATITPTLNLRDFDEVTTISWTAITHADLGGSVSLNSGLKRGTVSFAGTFGASAGTYILQGSIDGSNWASIRDLQGNFCSSSAVYYSFEFETVFSYMRVVRAGGTADSINVNVAYLLNRLTYGAGQRR